MTDAATVPPDFRERAFMAAKVVLELFDLCLDEAEKRFAAELDSRAAN